jgi:phosphoribosylformimino-5-aminoimidazole carboxamide ribotide isomerase
VRRENQKKIRRIRKAVKCQLHVGGGIRTDDDIERYMDLGIDRLVVSTVFVRRPGLVEGWSRHYGDVFLAGIDAHDGQVRISGWQQETNISDLDLAGRAKEVRCAGIVYTSIGRDGTLEGPDIQRTNKVAEAAGMPVLASGGIGSRQDIDKLAQEAGTHVVGVIVGRAIYEDKIKLDEVYKDYPQEEVVGVSW